MQEGKEYQVLLFYKYFNLEKPEGAAAWLRSLAQKHQLTGRAILATEGINATFEGVTSDTEKFAQSFLKNPLFSDVKIKRSRGFGESFHKLSVKVRDEIVGTKFSKEEADPRVKTAPRLSAEELKSWYQTNKDFVVVDMRNDYEYKSGHFKNSVEAGIEASRDLPQAIKNLEPLKNKTLLTVCTGGVRCEKMSAYLLNKGFDNVYQLEDGIHGYMEKYPGEDYQGTLYTFDRRLTMDFGGDREIIGTCRNCNAKTERYVNCDNDKCHLHFLVCTDCIPLTETPYCKDECRPVIV